MSKSASSCTVVTALVVGALLGGCVGSNPSAGARSQAAATSAERLSQQLMQASELAQRYKFEEAAHVLAAVVDDPDFGALVPAQQHTALSMAANIAKRRLDYARAYQMVRRASEMPIADRDDWMLRYEIAWAQRDNAEKVRCLTRIARSWPNDLTHLSKAYLYGTFQAARADPQAKYALLQALFVARGYLDPQLAMSRMWRDLALLDLEHGDPVAGLEAVELVTEPRFLIGVIVDNRFAPLRERMAAPIDIDAAVAAELARLRALVERHPAELNPVVRLTSLMLYTHQADRALASVDDVIARIKAQPDGPPLYADQADEYVWILQMRSDALYQLSRTDEAIEQLKAARLLTKPESPNVSQTINLAGLYNDLSRPIDARTTLDEIACTHTSPYGCMQLECERLRAALTLSDSAEIARSFAYLREHESDAPFSFQDMLLYAGRTQEAEQMLLARLRDPWQRQGALIAVQDYQNDPGPAAVESWRASWRALVATQSVQDAIARVGTIRHFNIAKPSGVD